MQLTPLPSTPLFSRANFAAGVLAHVRSYSAHASVEDPTFNPKSYGCMPNAGKGKKVIGEATSRPCGLES